MVQIRLLVLKVGWCCLACPACCRIWKSTLASPLGWDTLADAIDKMRGANSAAMANGISTPSEMSSGVSHVRPRAEMAVLKRQEALFPYSSLTPQPSDNLTMGIASNETTSAGLQMQSRHDQVTTTPDNTEIQSNTLLDVPKWQKAILWTRYQHPPPARHTDEAAFL